MLYHYLINNKLHTLASVIGTLIWKKMHKRLFLSGSFTENPILAKVLYSCEGFMKKNGRWILVTKKIQNSYI